MDSSVDADQRVAQLLRVQHENGLLLFNTLLLHVTQSVHGARKLCQSVQPRFHRGRFISQLHLFQFPAREIHEITNKGNVRVLALQIFKRKPVIANELLKFCFSNAKYRRHLVGRYAVMPAKVIGVPPSPKQLLTVCHFHR
jgi:hypothetical protein